MYSIFVLPITYIESSRSKFDGCGIGTSLIHNVKVIEIFRRILCFLAQLDYYITYNKKKVMHLSYRKFIRWSLFLIAETMSKNVMVNNGWKDK